MRRRRRGGDNGRWCWEAASPLNTHTSEVKGHEGTGRERGRVMRGRCLILIFLDLLVLYIFLFYSFLELKLITFCFISMQRNNYRHQHRITSNHITSQLSLSSSTSLLSSYSSLIIIIIIIIIIIVTLLALDRGFQGRGTDGVYIQRYRCQRYKKPLALGRSTSDGSQDTAPPFIRWRSSVSSL